MALFSGAESSYLGIDFHTNNVKVVELKNDNGRPRLVTYGYVDLDIDRLKINDQAADQAKIAKVIQQVCRQAKTTASNVVAALPAYSVFSSIFNLPPLGKKALIAAVERQAQKVIPLPLNEMVLDWKIIDDGWEKPASPVAAGVGEAAKNKFGTLNQRKVLKISGQKKATDLKVLLTAAPKDLVKSYINIFHRAKLNLLTLDTAAFALIRSLVGNDPSALLMVDVGAVVTNIMVVVGGIPVLNRSTQVGGLTVTKAIASQLNISLDQAEQFKYDVGLGLNQTADPVPKIVETILTPLVDELKYTLANYQSQGRRPIEKVILTGGSALLLNLPEFLAQRINLKVYRGDPWARVIYPEELKPVLDEVGARFSVAIGLAMRYIL